MGGGDEVFQLAGFLIHRGGRFEVALTEFGIGAVVKAVIILVRSIGISGGLASRGAGEAGFEGLGGGGWRG